MGHGLFQLLYFLPESGRLGVHVPQLLVHGFQVVTRVQVLFLGAWSQLAMAGGEGWGKGGVVRGVVVNGIVRR